MSLYQINNKLIGPANGFYVFEGSTPPEPPTLTSYSGILELQWRGYGTRFAQGFNGLVGIWDDDGGKMCADIKNKTLKADITGYDVTFKIINWYRSYSDYVGTAYFDCELTNDNNTFTFPSTVTQDELHAFGDYSTIYMTWSASYPANENVCVSGKINEANQTMFVYNGETNFRNLS